MSVNYGLIEGSALLALAAVAVGIKATAAIARDPSERRFLRVIFVAALLLRLGLAVVTYIWFPYGYFAPDEAGAVRTASNYINGVAVGSPAVHGQAWFYFNALIFQVFGPEPLLPRFWNCVIGAVTTLLGYVLARDFGATRGARWSAILIAFFPSLVLWSTINLHDVDAYFVILLAFVLTVRLQESPRWWLVVAVAMTLFAMYLLRVFADAALFVAVACGLLAPRLGIPARMVRPLALAASIAVAGAFVIVEVFPRPGQYVYARLGLEQLARLRHGLASGARSAVDPDPGLQTLGGAIEFLPHGLVNFFLRPFPWEGGSSLSVLTRPETILYYALLPLVVVGIVLAVKRVALRTLPSLAFMAVAGSGYAVVISNLGTSFRQRGQLLIVMFVFVGVAVDAIATWRRRTLGYMNIGSDSFQSTEHQTPSTPVTD